MLPTNFWHMNASGVDGFSLGVELITCKEFGCFDKILVAASNFLSCKAPESKDTLISIEIQRNRLRAPFSQAVGKGGEHLIPRIGKEWAGHQGARTFTR